MKSVNEMRERSIALGAVDLIGFACGAFLIAWFAFLNKRTTDYAATFDPWVALFMWILFACTYSLIFARLGNIRWGGLQSIALTSIGGSLLYLVVTMVWSFIVSGSTNLSTNGFEFYLVIVAVFVISTVPIVVVLRLGGNLVAYFHRRESQRNLL